MDLALIAASVIAGWLFLCLISGERERAAHEKHLSDLAFRPTELPIELTGKTPLDSAKN